MAIAPLSLRRLALADVNAAPYNPRVKLKSTDPEYQDIKRSLHEFGLVEPLVWNVRTGNLVGGHQRMQIMQDEGETEADFSVVDLDPTEERLLNLALNKVRGRWDQQQLAELLGTLKAQNAPIVLTGFRGDELTESLRRYTAQHSADFLSDVLSGQSATDAAVAQALGQPAFPGNRPADEDGADEDGADEDAAEATEDGEDEDDTDGTYPGSRSGGQAPQRPSDAPAGPDSGGFVGPEPTVYFQLTYTVTPEQRDLVQAALKAVRVKYDLATSMEALVQLCDDYLTRERGA